MQAAVDAMQAAFEAAKDAVKEAEEADDDGEYAAVAANHAATTAYDYLDSAIGALERAASAAQAAAIAAAAEAAAAKATAARDAEGYATSIIGETTVSESAAAKVREALCLAIEALDLAEKALELAKAAAGGDGGGDGTAAASASVFSGTIGGKLVNSAGAPRIIVTNKKEVFFGGPDAVIIPNDTLTVTVDLSDMKVLQEVDINGKAAFFTVDPTSYISLRQRYGDDDVSDDIVIVKEFTGSTPADLRHISIADTGHALPPLPLDARLAVDIDMVLDVVLKYRAFGRAFDGTLWNIANGFYPAADEGSKDADKTELNGGILIRFGAGSAL
jgi:hypothetical protein